MNAIEARELSKQNEISKARSELLMVISEMESNIEEGAKGGHFQAIVRINPSNVWIKYGATHEMRRHFEDKGFSFKSSSYLNNNLVFICSW